jgi:hypothetical protein
MRMQEKIPRLPVDGERVVVTGEEMTATVVDRWRNEEHRREWARVLLDGTTFAVPAMDLRTDRTRLTLDENETIPGFVIWRKADKREEK